MKDRWRPILLSLRDAQRKRWVKEKKMKEERKSNILIKELSLKSLWRTAEMRCFSFELKIYVLEKCRSGS